LGEHLDTSMKQLRIAAVFPGQGSQFAGMSKVLRDAFPWTKDIYEEASDALNENLLKLCDEGPEDTLQLTKNAQPAILVTSYAWWQVLRRELDLRATAAAGHSLGEYTALLSQGAMTLPEAVRLVRKRGELMQDAVPAGKGKMAALLGLDDTKVEELCQKASQGEHSIVVPANFNAPGQVVIAGHAEAVDRAQALTTTDPNLKARKFIPLKVSAPFHSPLMTPVAETFDPYLKSVVWKPWAAPVAFNVDGKLRAEGDVAQLLKEQLDHPVRWTTCAASLAGDSKTVFVETGPGKVLTGLIKRIVTGATLVSVDSVEELRGLERMMKEVENEVTG
jgi:[acyl-carrier-protein] S-malonyltransferase